MASWTDLIPQFKPYVEQLPVEAMVKVGMQKQAQYEEGVRKIQAQIDSVSGLDIIKDVDKNYLQSKLDELGSGVRGLAAADFSNFQLVNSVSGMTKQITKDKNIQNAIASTANYRKEKQFQESLRKEGKNGVSNDWLFNSESDNWLNDGQVGSSFNAKYQQYTNWKKNSLEVIKALTKDETITDDAFKTDEKGNLVITDAIVRKKLAGISPEKIQQALTSALSPNDFKQMEIDGRYNYSNVDDKTFISKVNSSYTDKIDFFKNQKTVLENAKSSTNSVVEKNKLDDQIASLDKTINSLSKEYNSITETFTKGDVESAKARLFTTDALAGFSKAFSHTETSLTYENSPLADMQMRREVKNMEWKKFTLDYAQKERFHKEDITQKELDRAEKKEENRLKRLELEGYGGLPGPVDPSMVPKYDLNKLTTEVNEGLKNLSTSDNAFIAQKGKNQAWFDQQKDAWERSPNSVDPEVANHFRSTADLRRKIAGDQQVILDANKAAVAKYGTIDDLIPKDAKSVDYFSKDGNYRYSPKDFVEFNSMLSRYVTTSVGYGGGSAGVSTTYNDAAARSELSPKMYNLYKIYKSDRNKLGAGGKELIKNLTYYAQNVNTPYTKTLSAINDETSKIVNERLTTMQGVSYEVPVATTAQKASISRVLNDFANLADKTGGSLPNSPKWNSEIGRKLAIEEKIVPSFTVVEGTERQPKAYMMTVSGKAGTVSMRITPEQKTAVFGQMFEASPAVQAIRPYQEQIRKTGGYSTAPMPNSPTTQYNSYLESVDFPNMGIYGVKGNLVNVGNNLYTIKLAIYNPATKSWNNDISFPRSGLLTEEAVAPTMLGLNDAVIYELLNEKPATSRDLQVLKSASKQPL